MGLGIAPGGILHALPVDADAEIPGLSFPFAVALLTIGLHAVELHRIGREVKRWWTGGFQHPPGVVGLGDEHIVQPDLDQAVVLQDHRWARVIPYRFLSRSGCDRAVRACLSTEPPGLSVAPVFSVLHLTVTRCQQLMKLTDWSSRYHQSRIAASCIPLNAGGAGKAHTPRASSSQSPRRCPRPAVQVPSSIWRRPAGHRACTWRVTAR